MKKNILIIALSFFVLNCFSNTAKEASVVVPAAVKQAFLKTFPKATNTEWGIEKPGEFEAEFKLNNVATSALFNKNGALLETETGMTLSTLPVAVKATLTKSFVGFKLQEIEKTTVKGVASFEMIAAKGKENFELVFDLNGKLLKKEVVKKEDKED